MRGQSYQHLERQRAAYRIISKELEAFKDILLMVCEKSGLDADELKGTWIRIGYYQLIAEGYPPKEAKFELADRHFCSVKTVERHLYRIVIKKKARA